MNLKMALFFGTAAVFGGLVFGGLYYFMRPVAHVPPPPQREAPVMYVVDTSKLRTVKDVAALLEALNIRIGVVMSDQTPEVEKFKKGIEYFKVLK